MPGLWVESGRNDDQSKSNRESIWMFFSVSLACWLIFLAYLNPRAPGEIQWLGWVLYIYLLTIVCSVLAKEMRRYGPPFELGGVLFGFMGVTGFLWTIAIGSSVNNLLLLVAGLIRFSDGYGLATSLFKFSRQLVPGSLIVAAIYALAAIGNTDIDRLSITHTILLFLSIPACFLSTLGICTLLFKEELLKVKSNSDLAVFLIGLPIALSYLASPDLLLDGERLLFYLMFPIGIGFSFLETARKA